MGEQEKVLCKYKTILPEIFDSVAMAIGKHVLLVVLERSMWKTKIKYPEAGKVKFSENGIDITALDDVGDVKASLIVNEFILSIIDTLGRLVGLQVAQKLTEKLTNETGCEGDK
jgi:hypothetical protein